EHQIAVTAAEVDKGIDDFRRMVMTPGCSCCGGNFKSLEQYMRINGYTMAELRRQIRCDLGIKGYEERLTLERTSPAILAEAADRDHGQIEANYVQARAILFDNRKAPEYYRDEQAAAAGKETQARKAWERLQKGDTFERVAREMSDDTASAAKGGALGVVRADVLGEEVEQVLHELEPGICSGVVKANWGCCIVMRQKLTEGDVLSVVRDQAKEVVEAQLYQKLRTAREEADIQYLDESLKPIVATTAPSSRPN
ncbi:MAG: peptidylprolyl isomerase, partial [Planctomycetota bacterium]|nr:peptidylprolyl isomerase [Planctomycetota bacterium]